MALGSRAGREKKKLVRSSEFGCLLLYTARSMIEMHARIARATTCKRCMEMDCYVLEWMDCYVEALHLRMHL
jgi:hypothetical protein